MGTRIDDDVLKDMSVALSQGRRVRFTPEGDPSASLDAQSTGLQQPAADFLGTKVDEINALLDKGLEVNVDPDGSIFAFTPDRSSRYLSDPNPEIESFDRLIVHDAIGKGANLVIEPDGSMGYHIPPGTTPPSADQVAARVKAFDEQLDSGKLSEAVKAGKQFELSSEGSMSYVVDDSSGISGVAGGATAPGTPGTPDTTDAADTAPGGDTGSPDATASDADAMRAESAEATQMAARIREVAYDHFTEDYTALSITRDDEARRVWALRQEASSADMQIKREQRNVDMYQQELAGADAAKGTDYGMDPGVYDHTRAMAAIAQGRLDAATKHAADLRSQADAAEQQVAVHEQSLKDLDQ
ncbi:MAG TPA: hypothetical protein VMS14_03710, partial [Ilumatobacteraceae bacterium]|nr:hypothetical protein [Ilumatobacteraceae bacterium]